MHKITTSEITSLVEMISAAEGTFISAEQELHGVWLHSADWTTELRLSIYCERFIMVSRVVFNKQRAGTMTKVFEWMKQYAITNGLEGCVIQSVYTPAMAAWCLKNGLSPKLSTCYESNGCQYGYYYFYLNSLEVSHIKL